MLTAVDLLITLAVLTVHLGPAHPTTQAIKHELDRTRPTPEES